MQTAPAIYEELLIYILLFLDSPTLRNAIALDREWHFLVKNNRRRKLLGPWVKAYLRNNLFRTKTITKSKVVRTIHSIKPIIDTAPYLLPTCIADQLIEKNQPHPVLDLVFNKNNKENLPMFLLASTIAPTMAFIMTESLTHDLEASLYAVLMMFGVGISAALLGAFRCCSYIDDVLTNILINSIHKKKRQKLLAMLFDLELNENFQTVIQTQSMNAFALTPKRINSKITLF